MIPKKFALETIYYPACDGYANAPILDYINPVCQELLPENTYMLNTFDGRIYIYLRKESGKTK